MTSFVFSSCALVLGDNPEAAAVRSFSFEVYEPLTFHLEYGRAPDLAWYTNCG